MKYFTVITKTLLAILCVAAIACSAKQKNDTYLNYSESAKVMFDNGMESFERGRWAEADKIFIEVKRQFPYSRYASYALLRIGDCHFSLGSHPEAAVSYRQFLKTYPTHEEAHYAAFRVSESYYEQIPGDWLLLPPSHERDQTATRDARSSLARFITTYPGSEHIEKAKELYIDVENALVRHEMYVAQFYLKRGRSKAAAIRLESVGRQFPGSRIVPDAMFLRAITFLKMDEVDKALEVFEDIVRLYPDDPQAKRAKAYMRSLGS